MTDLSKQEIKLLQQIERLKKTIRTSTSPCDKSEAEKMLTEKQSELSKHKEKYK
jgi:hypothetical protein